MDIHKYHTLYCHYYVYYLHKWCPIHERVATAKHEVAWDELLGTTKELTIIIYTMMQLSNLFLCWLRCCSLLVIGHTSLYIPLFSSHHGNWQRILLCSLKFNPYGTVVLPGVGEGGRERWKCGSGGVGVCCTVILVSRCKHYMNFCMFQSLLWEGLLCPQQDL